ncbi:3-dehydrosphinganine reductase [Boothiomyces sp. JEL0838]|nr:3-dehydrosphinganine reductase [Boothiomyces sp. JEL0838]
MNFSAALSQYYGEYLILTLIVLAGLPITGLLGVILNWKLSLSYNQKSVSKKVRGKHCLVTGASQGLGKATAIELVKAGAHVTIIARGKKDPKTGISSLDSVVKELELSKVNPDQIIQFFAVDLTVYDKVVEMFEKLFEQGHNPEFLFCNAGSATPGLFIDQLPVQNKEKYEEGEHEWMMKSNYFTHVNVIRALLQVARKGESTEEDSICGISSKIAIKLPKSIILVGSVLSTLSFVGFSAYSASKYAIRGFADAMRSEMKPLGVHVGIYYPGNMATPGFEIENETKPKITAKIEGSSETVSAKSAAESLLAGFDRNLFYYSNDLLGELARVSVNGGNPRPYPVVEKEQAPGEQFLKFHNYIFEKNKLRLQAKAEDMELEDEDSVETIAIEIAESKEKIAFFETLPSQTQELLLLKEKTEFKLSKQNDQFHLLLKIFKDTQFDLQELNLLLIINVDPIEIQLDLPLDKNNIPMELKTKILDKIEPFYFNLLGKFSGWKLVEFYDYLFNNFTELLSLEPSCLEMYLGTSSTGESQRRYTIINTTLEILQGSESEPESDEEYWQRQKELELERQERELKMLGEQRKNEAMNDPGLYTKERILSRKEREELKKAKNKQGVRMRKTGKLVLIAGPKRKKYAPPSEEK